jgi:hypothetical protein
VPRRPYRTVQEITLPTSRMNATDAPIGRVFAEPSPEPRRVPSTQFATSVGSGSLTLMAACIIGEPLPLSRALEPVLPLSEHECVVPPLTAVFTEFIGAITLGADVTDTIKSGTSY